MNTVSFNFALQQDLLVTALPIKFNIIKLLNFLKIVYFIIKHIVSLMDQI